MRSCWRLAAVLLGTFTVGGALVACGGPSQNPFADDGASLSVASTATGGGGASTASSNAGGSGNASSGTAGAPVLDAGSSSGGAAGSVSAPTPPGGMASGGSDGAAGSAGSGAALPTAVLAPTSSCYGKLRVPDPVVSDCELNGVKGWFGYVNDTRVVPVALHPGANGTQTAAEFKGQQADISGVGISLFCDDVTRYAGVSFWAKGNGGEHLRFLAAVPGTDAAIGRGDCVPAQMTCNDHPGKPFELAAGWNQYTVRWDELKQIGWGSPASFDGVINSLLWINDGPVMSFDFAIDEVQLIEP
jgi:hypothetical protein